MPPSQKHQECQVKVIPQRHGDREGNEFGWQCLLPSSLFVSPLTGPGTGKARPDMTALPCCAPAAALPRLLTAGVIPACLCPSHCSSCLNDLCSTGSGCHEDFFPGHPNVRGETEIQAPSLHWCLVIPAHHHHWFSTL